MTTKKKHNKRLRKKMNENCWSLDQHLMDYTTKHLQHFLKSIRKSKCAGYPAEFFEMNEKEAVAKWESIIEDMIYFTSSYELYCNGRPENESQWKLWCDDNKHPFVKMENDKMDMYEFKTNDRHLPKWLYKLDAVDKERYLRGRKMFMKWFSNLWW